MSDMINKLRGIADEAGNDAAENLRSPDTIAVLDHRVRRGVRRRRARIASTAVAATVVLGGVGVMAPILFGQDQVTPNDEPRTVLHSTGGLTVFSDGSMSILTDAHTIIDLAVPEEGNDRIVPTSNTEVCAWDPDTDLNIGWDFVDANGSQLLTFVFVESEDYDGNVTVVPYGDVVEMVPSHEAPSIRVAVNANSAIADHLVVQLTSIEVIEGVPVYYGLQLDSQPDVTFHGTSTENRAAVVRTTYSNRELKGICDNPESLEIKNRLSSQDWDDPDAITRSDVYFIADVWVTDRLGNVTYLGRNTSWAVIKFLEPQS